MSALLPIINGHSLHRQEAVRLTQSFDFIPPARWRRTLTGRLVSRPHWTSLATTISGTAWQPPSLMNLQAGDVVSLGCVAPLAMTIDPVARVGALAFPARDDAKTWALAVVNGAPVSTPVTRSGRAVEVSAVAGATAYRVHWFPVLQVFTKVNSAVHARNNASQGWSLDAELVDGASAAAAPAAATAAAARQVESGQLAQGDAFALLVDVLSVVDASTLNARESAAVAAAAVIAVAYAGGTATATAVTNEAVAATAGAEDVLVAAAEAAANEAGVDSAPVLVDAQAATAEAAGAFGGVSVASGTVLSVPEPVFVDPVPAEDPRQIGDWDWAPEGHVTYDNALLDDGAVVLGGDGQDLPYTADSVADRVTVVTETAPTTQSTGFVIVYEANDSPSPPTLGLRHAFKDGQGAAQFNTESLDGQNHSTPVELAESGGRKVWAATAMLRFHIIDSADPIATAANTAVELWAPESGITVLEIRGFLFDDLG